LLCIIAECVLIYAPVFSSSMVNSRTGHLQQGLLLVGSTVRAR